VCFGGGDESFYMSQNIWTALAGVPVYYDAKFLKQRERAELRLVRDVPRRSLEAGPNPVS